MLAAILEELNKPLVLKEMPAPEPGAGEVRVEVKASGLCSSDLHYMNGGSKVGKLPIILGHETAGVIDKKGPGVRSVEEGERVAVHYLLTCGECVHCRSGRENLCGDCGMLGKSADGGFAGYVSVPEQNVIPVPEGVSFEHAAIAADAVATPYHAIKLAGIGEGDAAVIAGVGGLGAHAVQMPGLFGAEKVIAVDISEEKLNLALELGADYALNAASENVAERISEITGGKGADAVLELTGIKKSIEKLAGTLAIAGRMVLVGICPDRIELDSYNDILLKEAVFTGNRDHLASEIREVLKLIKDGRLDLSKSISRRISLREINEGFRSLREREGSPVRIVVTEFS
jgi:alcohol dehydrogenase, propanol-preferring